MGALLNASRTSELDDGNLGHELFERHTIYRTNPDWLRSFAPSCRVPAGFSVR